MKPDRKKTMQLMLYAVLYVVMTAIVCVTWAVHPVFFVCYQITAGILLSGVIITAFRRVQTPGTAACLFLGLLLLLLIIKDAAAWHVIPLAVLTVLAELIRAVFKYSWKGDVAAAAVKSFSSFGYYGQIWFNRAYTYECAVEEMPAGYAETLMAVSPAWVLPVVIIIGIVLSVLISSITAKFFRLEK
ncbi:MAG: MptD family putative ECF transporter S component [Solobacterium sp.]|nr:MptD family putative ECF transporter S component [Solobacterium sp.]